MVNVGDRFGKLVVVAILSKKNNDNRAMVLCQCDCGNIKEISVKALTNKRTSTQSCGCLRLEAIHKKTKHGQSGSRFNGKRTQLYRCWSNIKSRCYNQKVRSYADYGAKGIKMCDEWLNDFEAFSDWSYSHGFEEGLTINRIDSDKDYSPDNCEWITLSENSRLAKKEVHCWGKNLATDEYCEFDNIRQFARERGLNYSAIDQVLHRHNKTHKTWIFGYL